MKRHPEQLEASPRTKPRRVTVFLTVSNQRIRATKHCDITPCPHVTVPLLAPFSCIRLPLGARQTLRNLPFSVSRCRWMVTIVPPQSTQFGGIVGCMTGIRHRFGERPCPQLPLKDAEIRAFRAMNKPVKKADGGALTPILSCAASRITGRLMQCLLGQVHLDGERLPFAIRTRSLKGCSSDSS